MIKSDPSLEESKQRQATQLQTLLDKYKNERVIVIGGTCTGKSTLLQHLPGSKDMDNLIFPLLTKEEADYVCRTPWTPAIGKTMSKLTKERVKVRAGEPVFGTVVLDADRIIHLKISDDLLRKRTASRGVSFTDAKNMQQHIEAEIAATGLPVIEFAIG